MSEGYKYLGKVQIKKWFKEYLKPFCKEYGFKFGSLHGQSASLIKKQSQIVVSTYVDIDRGDKARFIKFSFDIPAISDLLEQLTGELSTKFFRIYESLVKGPEQVFSEVEVSKMVFHFTEVYKNKVAPQIKKYQDYNEILNLWDSSTREEQVGIFNDPNAYMKLLVLTKYLGRDDLENRYEEAMSFFQKNLEKGIMISKKRMEDCTKVMEYLRDNEVEL